MNGRGVTGEGGGERILSARQRGESDREEGEGKGLERSGKTNQTEQHGVESLYAEKNGVRRNDRDENLQVALRRGGHICAIVISPKV